jgi:hypothetical protein
MISLGDNDQLTCNIVLPRWKKSKGVIVYCSNIDEDANILFHTTLRPLAALGWEVICAPPLHDKSQIERAIISLTHTYPQEKIFVAGDSEGGMVAWKIAVEIPDQITAGAGYGFLSLDANQTKDYLNVKRPFLIGQSLYDDQVSANAAILAKQGRVLAGTPVSVLLTSGSTSKFSPQWHDWICSVDLYFEKE